MDETASGRRIAVHVGDLVEAELGSTYWSFTTAPTPVLRAAGSPVTSPGTGCVAGSGCGTITAQYRVVAAGTAVVTAVRTLCGEALRCTPPQHFAVTLIATNG